jgi:hypothetical protein
MGRPAHRPLGGMSLDTRLYTSFTMLISRVITLMGLVPIPMVEGAKYLLRGLGLRKVSILRRMGSQCTERITKIP